MPSDVQAALAAALREPGSDAATREHLKRWADDHRAEASWSKIKHAAQQHGSTLVAGLFVQEILSTRRVAEVVDQRRAHRDRYSSCAAIMEEIADFLCELPSDGGPPPVPFGETLAAQLREAAKILRREAAASFMTPAQIKVSRKKRDRVRVAFTSMVSNDLKRSTGRWHDEDVAMLAQIALDERDITVEQVRRARQSTIASSRAKGRMAKPRSRRKILYGGKK